jgi:hypothetical protein
VAGSGATLGAAVLGTTEGAVVGAAARLLLGAVVWVETADRTSVAVTVVIDGDDAGLLGAVLLIGAVVEVGRGDRTSVPLVAAAAGGVGLALDAADGGALCGARPAAGDVLGLGEVLWPALVVDAGVGVGDPLGIGDPTA